MQFEGDIGVRFAEMFDVGGKRTVNGGADKPDAQSTCLACANINCPLSCVFDGVEKSACVCKENSTRLGQLNRASVSNKERDSKRFLQNCYLLRKWRLCHVEPLGCSSEVQFFSDSNEVANLLCIHC